MDRLQAQIGESIQLPTKFGEFMVRHIAVLGAGASGVKEGVALISTRRPTGSAMYVRVQSSCLFSESFWATDCECALQLARSLQLTAEHGGMVLYFYEEGRGAGLMTKIQAIWLQQNEQKNTSEAYACLRFPADVRSYEPAATALKKLLPSARHPVILLTNNPSKMKGLEEAGIAIERVEPLICGVDNLKIRAYLEDKRDTLHHNIDI